MQKSCREMESLEVILNNLLSAENVQKVNYRKKSNLNFPLGKNVIFFLCHIVLFHNLSPIISINHFYLIKQMSHVAIY